MLKLKHPATVKSVALNKTQHGDDMRKFVTVKLEMAGVALDVLRDGFVSQASLLFDKDGNPAFTEIAPLQITREVGNVSVRIDGVSLKGMDVDNVAIEPRPGSTADVTLKVKGTAPEGAADSLWTALFETVPVEFEERQLKLAPEPEAKAANG